MSASPDDFAAALVRTVEVMGGTLLAVEPPTRVDVSSISADVSACIDVRSGERLVVMTASAGAATDLVRTLTGADAAWDDPTAGDALGEILNVVVGCAEKGDGSRFSVPVIVRGQAHHVPVGGVNAGVRVAARTRSGALDLWIIDGRNAT